MPTPEPRKTKPRHTSSVMDEAPSNLFTSLPTCLSGQICSEWIKLAELARLDSAFCNRSSRASLLELMKSNECISHDRFRSWRSRSWSNSMFDWLIERGVKVTHIDCNMYWDETRLNAFVTLNASHGRCLYLPGTLTLPATALCDKLTVFDGVLSKDVCTILKNNPRLEVLSLCDLGLIPGQALEGLTLPVLRDLTITLDTVRLCKDGQSLLTLVQATRCLRKLHLFLDERIPVSVVLYEALCTMASHCPKLIELTIDSADVPDAIIATIAQSCPLITHLDLTANQAITDAGVEAVVTRLTLATLKLAKASRITDTSVHLIAAHCAETLEVLHLGNFLIHQATVIGVKNRFAKLRECKLERPCVAYDDVDWEHGFDPFDMGSGDY